jgi:4-amino-4-deoxy-L-arabinose transferase-like glycosyltransferase
MFPVANCWALSLALALAARTKHKENNSKEVVALMAFCLSFWPPLAFPREINSVFATALLNLRPNSSRQQ